MLKHGLLFFLGKVPERAQLRGADRRGFDPEVVELRRRLPQVHRQHVRGRPLRPGPDFTKPLLVHPFQKMFTIL